MELKVAARLARRWWWVLITAAAGGAALSYALSLQIPPTYEATTTLLVTQGGPTAGVRLSEMQASERLADTFSRLALLRPVLDDAITTGILPLTTDEVADRVRVSSVPGTQLLEVTARESDPELAARIADAVATSLTESQGASAATGLDQVKMVESAAVPSKPVRPQPLVNAALAGMLALGAALGVVLLAERLDETVGSPQAIQELTGALTLARVARFREAQGPLVVATDPRSSVAEAYRTLRTRLLNAGRVGTTRRVLLVTSADPGEGKTTTTANLAVAFGLQGHRVCVVDTDLRRPTIHRVFGVSNVEGLTNLLLRPDPDFRHAIQATPFLNVSVVTSGPLPSNPAELAGSGRMEAVLGHLRAQFDVVLLDSTPVLAVTDAVALAGLADALILVARAGRTRRGALKQAMEQLAQSGSPLAGVVLNGTSEGDPGAYGYGAAPDESPLPRVAPRRPPA